MSISDLESACKMIKTVNHQLPWLSCCHDAHLLVIEAWDEEERGGEEQHHERGAGLTLPQPAVHHDLVQPPQLGSQGLVLALQCFDLVLNRE